MTEVHSHITTIALSEPLPEQVPAGAEVTIKVAVACAEGCELDGAPVKATAADGEAVTIELASQEAEIDNTAVILLRTPQTLGEHAWTLVFPAHEKDGVLHSECSLPIHIKSIPHGTSLAVWDIPSPVILGSRFAIKVGAKSASGCDLNGCEIDVCDDTGAPVGRGRLQAAVWPGTSALYWTEVVLEVPASEGMRSWSVRFAAAGVALPHDGSQTGFSFMVARAPEHTLTVKVVEKDTGTPIENAQVRLGAYRAATDENGRAEVQVPKGAYDLTVWKAGYESPEHPMDVNGDAAIEVEVVKIPEMDPDTYWTM